MRLLLACIIVAAAAASASAATVEPPKRKSGLWEMTVTSPQMPGGRQTMRQCIDQNTDDMMRKAQRERMSCTKDDMRREGDKVVNDAVCTVEGTTVETHTVFSGRFDANYNVDVKSTYNPPLNGMRESSSHIQGKWLGQCLAGQKPGDVIMPGMPPTNMQEMQRGMNTQPPPQR